MILDKLIKITDEEYFENKEFINASLLKTIHFESPLHTTIDKKSSSLSFGSAYHCYILENEEFDKRYYVLNDTFVKKGKVCKLTENSIQGREEIERLRVLNEGKKSITLAEMNLIEKMANSVNSSAFLSSFISNGLAEYSLFTTFHGFKVKIKLDYVIETEDKITIVDVKTSQCSNQRSFRRDVYKFGYDLSASFYHDIIKSVFKKDIEYLWLVSEKKAPYCSCVYGLPDFMLIEGREKYLEAIHEYDSTIKKGVYPGYKATSEIVYFEH